MTALTVLTKKDNKGVGYIILNRPKVNNAYNSDMIDGLNFAVDRFSADDEVRVIVIRGNGRHFQAGADLRWIANLARLSYEVNLAVSENTSNAISALNLCCKPTIALVHGGCIGGGTGIIAACDMVLASSDSFFSISEVRWGLHAGPILPQLAAAIGVRNLRRLALSGEKFDAYQSQKIGLVHEICEPGGLDAAINPILDMILQNGPEAIKDTKRIILEITGSVSRKNLAKNLVKGHALKRTSEEAKEGLRSFIEKRPAKW